LVVITSFEPPPSAPMLPPAWFPVMRFRLTVTAEDPDVKWMTGDTAPDPSPVSMPSTVTWFDPETSTAELVVPMGMSPTRLT